MVAGVDLHQGSSGDISTDISPLTDMSGFMHIYIYTYKTWLQVLPPTACWAPAEWHRQLLVSATRG